MTSQEVTGMQDVRVIRLSKADSDLQEAFDDLREGVKLTDTQIVLLYLYALHLNTVKI